MKNITVLLGTVLLFTTITFAGDSKNNGVQNPQQTKTEDGQKAEEPPKGISVYNIWKDFQDDYDSAEERYMGKYFTVNGTVTDTFISIYATPVVSLSNEEDGTVYALCVLPRADFGKLSSYKEKQKVVMKGRIYRATEKSVVIKECKPE